MRKLLAAALILLLASPALADEQLARAFDRFDVDSDTITYQAYKGQKGNPYGGSISVKGKIKTTGSTTAVTAVDAAGTAPFDELAVGDLIEVRQPNGTVDRRFVAAKADADNITVDTNIDWENGGAGYDFRWWKASTCTDASCGAVGVGAFSEFNVEVGLERSDLATGIVFLVECRSTDTWKQVFPETAGTTQALSTAGAGTTVSRATVQITNTGYNECRVGVAKSGADTADVVNASTELFDAAIVGVTRK